MMSSTPVSIEIEGLEKTFGDVVAVDNIDIRFEPGLFYVLLGPSGCGKTTTLRLIAGLESPTGGSVRLDGHDVTDTPPFERDLGFVFQQYALFPHMSVERNIAFGPKMRRVPKDRIAAAVREGLEMVHLEGMEKRSPRALSGGQQQRVALARALVTRPRALLLDEPLSNLDKNLRDEMRVQIRSLQRSLGITAIMVTHDQSEALAIADRIVVMNKGRIEQIGTIEEVYRRPATLFAANFVGTANVIEGRLTGNGHLTSADGLRFPTPAAHHGRQNEAALVIRPADIRVVPGGEGPLAGKVIDTTYQGSSWRHVVELAAGRPMIVEIADGDDLRLQPGDTVGITYDPDRVHLLTHD